MRSLKNQSEFDFVNKKGYKFHTPHFILVKTYNSPVVKNNIQAKLLFGMKVGRKLGNAVVRNKIKRRIRHIIRLSVKPSEIADNRLALIIIPRKDFEKVEFSVLLNDFRKTLLK